VPTAEVEEVGAVDGGVDAEHREAPQPRTVEGLGELAVRVRIASDMAVGAGEHDLRSGQHVGAWIEAAQRSFPQLDAAVARRASPRHRLNQPEVGHRGPVVLAAGHQLGGRTLKRGNPGGVLAVGELE
jgi:hypothetical protein